MVKNIDYSNKKFCCLINRHDNGNTRKIIYENLSKLKNIDCPGLLYNNYKDPKGFDFDKEEFMKNYLFNICPENFKTSVDGYITEKLWHSCICGCIPIYYGKLDEIDFKIFNKNRIILFDPEDKISIINATLKVKILLEHKDLLDFFYKQPPFCVEALETV